MPRYDINGNLLPTASDLLPQLPPEEERSLAGSVLNAGLSGLSFLGNVLDTPGSIVRGLFHGDPGRAFGGILDPSQRVTGSELIGGSRDASLFSGEGLTGLGVELLTDPTTWFGGAIARGVGAGLKATGKGVGKVADVASHIPVIGPPIAATRELGGKAMDAGGRLLAGAFKPEVMGQYDTMGQTIARTLYPEKIAGQEAGALTAAQLVRTMGDDALDAAQRQGLRNFTELGEAATGVGQGARQGSEFAQKSLKDVLEEAQFLGRPKEPLENFFPRQVTEPTLDVAADFFSTPSSSREQILRYASTDRLNNMVKDAFVGTSKRTAPDNFAAAQHLVQNYHVSPQDADALASFLYGLHPERLKHGLFSNDPLTDFMGYMQSNVSKNNMVRKAYDLIAEHAGPASPGSMKVQELLGKLGLSGPKIDEFGNVVQGATEATKNASERAFEALQKAGKLAGDNPGVQRAFFDTMHVPQAVSNALGAILNPGHKVESDFTRLMKSLIDVPTNLTKGFLTTPFPAFHARNATSSLGWIQSILTGSPKAALEGNQMMTNLLRGESVKGISQWPSVQKIVGPGLTDEAASRAIGDWLFSKGLTSSGHVSDVLGKNVAPDILEGIPGLMKDRKVGLSAIGEYGRNYLPTSKDMLKQTDIRGVAGATKSTVAPFKAGEDLATVIEQTARGGGALALLKQGVDPDMVAPMVKAAHADYHNLTSFEKEVMRRLVPFYGFARSNVPYNIKQIMQNPGGAVGTAVKVTAKGREDGGFEPPWLSPGVAIPLGGEQNGQRRYLTSLGLPFEQIGDVFSPTKLAGNANPMLKMVVEGLTNRQLYSGRDLRDLHSRLEDLVGVPVSPGVENVLMNSPLSRVVTTAGTLTDPRKSWLDSALNLTTGARISDVDIAKSKRAALREGMMDELRGAPGVRTLPLLTFRPEEIQNMSPREKALARLYLEQQRRDRQRNTPSQ